MDDICESEEVPTLSYVVEHIYSSCDTEKNGSVLASALVDFVRPLMSKLPNGISNFSEILDPNNENPAISRSAFFEAMQKWIINIEDSDTLQHFSFRGPGSPHGTKLPFYQSTPKPSIEPSSTKNVTNILNLSNFSPTSFSNCKNTSTVGCENLLLEEKVKELEHKYGNAINELSMVKSQLLSSEEQYADLKKDLERTNKRLSLEQQIIVDLQKSIEHNDDIKEGIINTKKENEHLQKMLASSKKENSNLMALIRDLEFEKEQFERKMTEIHGKDDKRKEEITDLQMALSLREEENNALKAIKVELEDKVEEQMSLLKHFTEMSEFMKNENQTLRSVVRKMGLTDLSDISSIRDLPNLSSHDTASMTSSSGNAVCETFEDLDLSTVSEKHSFKGENLLSELQACKTLDQCNDCFVKEHEEMYEIVKEHESCPKIIEEYKEKIEMLTKNIEIIETEHKNLVDDYNHHNESIKYFKDQLDKEKNLNEHLASENFNLTKKIVNLIDIESEKEKQLKEFEYKTKELEGDVAKFKNKAETTSTEYNNLINKFDNLQNEKMFLEKQLTELNTEKTLLCNEICNLHTENDMLSNKIESKDNEIQELNIMITEKEHLEEDLRNTKFQQMENCNTIENLTKKLEESRNMGHYFVQIIKKKLTDQKTKVQFLNELNVKLEERVDKLKNDLQHMKTEMNLVKSKSELAFIEKSESRENMGNESTSTEGSETNLSTERPQYRKRQNYMKRINHEKQQVKIIKLEEQVELLQKELFNERSITQNMSNLEFQVNNLKLEKTSLEQEKNIILEQLDAIKYDMSLKENTMSEFEKSQKIEVDNLSKRFLKEKEIISANLMEALKRTEENEKLLRTQIDQLEKEVTTSKEEKSFLENLLSKKETKIITLKKTLSDIMKSSGEAKVFENIVIEKESMLQFNRELLMKSNNSLELSESCICSLNLLLDHCKVVLLETADDLFSAIKEAFEALKNDLNIIPEDFGFISTMKDFHKENSEFTVEIIEEIKCNLILSTKLLRSLAQKSGTICVLCRNNAPTIKGVNKFTLRPPKLQFRRLPSSDPDISSSCLKEVESPQADDSNIFSIQNTNKNKNDLEVPSMVRQSDSMTDWLGHHTNSVREALKNRKMTEKKFCHLASTWKSTLENAKNKYYNLKHQCSKVRDSYLRILLQIVTYLKNHKCHQEQKSLIQALKLIEKLKDLIFDVFKLAEQFGASRQELHSMKCWHFIVEYVNGVHKENEQLRLFQYIRCDQSMEDLPCRNLCSRDVSTETDNSEGLVVSSDANSYVHKGSKKKTIFEVAHQKSYIRVLSEKCGTFSMMAFSLICFIAMFSIYIHLECIRNGNDSIVCPLDFLVSIKRVKPEFHPH